MLSGTNGSPSGTTIVNYGGSQTYTITPTTGYFISDVTVDGVSQGAITSFPFTNVTANHAISASFTIISYNLRPSSGSGGTITTSGTAQIQIGTVAGNGTVSFTNLRIDAAGTNKQLTASASGLSNSVSSLFTVSPGAATSMAIQTQPPATATAGGVFSPATVIRLQDALGNQVTTDKT